MGFLVILQASLNTRGVDYLLNMVKRKDGRNLGSCPRKDAELVNSGTILAPDIL